MIHDVIKPNQRRGAAQALAPAWDALCCLPATHPWFWLVRSGPFDTAPAIGLVLLNAVSVLLDALGPGAFRHG
ncbi:hypothetical protein MACH21_26390 [Roseicyclus marinus]|uniref:Uncharacterized protein n=1 Tax=Roseicyclus marinus TaxID=2161673 RepID=A0AA48H6K9_9RHOB|nr:hypothetical protein MACH21_26390 [Roseicyclus marinus]